MRPVSAQWAQTVRQSHQRVARVSTYYAGAKTGEVPIVDGSVTFDTFAPASRRCTITVPVTYNGVSYNPASSLLAPLAANGQRLLVESGVVHPDGTEEYVSLGYFVITDWVVDVVQGTVTVTGADLWTLLERAPILSNNTSMRVPAAIAQRIDSVIETLLYPRLVPDPKPGTLPLEGPILAYSNGLPPSRVLNVQSAFQFKEGDSRTGAILDVATAWPCTLRVNDLGTLRSSPVLGPPESATPVDVYFTDVAGANPVLVERAAASDRDKIYNCVILSSRNSQTGASVGTHYTQYTTGVFRAQGPYGYYPLVEEVRLATTQPELQAMAAAKLLRMTLRAFNETLSVVPNAAVELDDVAQVSSPTLAPFKGRITGITLPLVSTGPMTVTLSNTTSTAAAAGIQGGTI